MRERAGFTAGLFFGALGVWILQKLFRTDDDRPPIRVRGGSAHFQHDYGWSEDGGDWKTKQSGAKKVKYFKVLVNGKPCGLQPSVQLDIIYQTASGRQETFKVIHRGGDPRVIPAGLLEQDPFYFDTIVHDAGNKGRLVKISGPPNPHNTCTLPEAAVIKIDYIYQ